MPRKNKNFINDTTISNEEVVTTKPVINDIVTTNNFIPPTIDIIDNQSTTVDDDDVEDDVNDNVNDSVVDNADNLADAENTNEEVKVPKKRGRKPKNKELIIKKSNNNDNEFNSDDDDDEKNNSITTTDHIIKAKRRGRKPKDKFKFENTDYDEFNKNNKREDNIIVKLPLSCMKLNEEFNTGKNLFDYTPVITNPKPYNPTYLNQNHIGYSKFSNNDGYNEVNNAFDTTEGNEFNNEEEDTLNEFTQEFPNNTINPQNFNNNEFNKCFDNLKKEHENKNLGNDINENETQKCNQCKYCKEHENLYHHYNNKKDSSSDVNNNNNNNNNTQQQPHGFRQIDIILNNKYNSNTDKFSVLTHLSSGLQNCKWLDKTDIACLWCCHSFTNIPWGIPYKYTNEKFQLFGNFCSPNCTLSYILNFYCNDENKWEKIALLNLLYFKVYGKYKNLMPAMDKMALKIFGGTLEIDEYRKISNDNEKGYNVEFPPCNTIIPMLEEIYKKNNLNNTFIPIDKNRIQIASSELKLKRTKPIINYKNTLDFSLGKVNA